MTITTLRRRVLAALVCVAAASVPADAQTADQLFDDTVVHEVRLRMNSRDLALLRERYTQNTFYVADFTWQGQRVRNVGVRSRGFGSRNPTKLGLLIDFDRYVSNRRVAGQKSLVLDNLWQDPSLLREKLAFSMFERMGVPAPRNSFARLYLNDVYQGLYALVEAIEEPMLSRTINDEAGYLFEYHWIRDFRATYPGTALAEYKPLFEARTREREADTLVYGPLEEMFRQINAPFDGAWRGRVEALVDLPAVIRQAAVENFIAENDGLLGYAGMNNFYLYRPGGSRQHRTFPWDKDNAFLQHDFAVRQRIDDNVLFARATQFEDLQALYYDTILEAAALTLTDNWLEGEIDRLLSIMGAAAAEDTRKQFTQMEFDEAIEFLRAFARLRPASVIQQIAELRGGGS